LGAVKSYHQGIALKPTLFLLLIQELTGDIFIYYLIFIGASPEPRKLLKKLDQNVSREKS
jgi:hypothetical protein